MPCKLECSLNIYFRNGEGTPPLVLVAVNKGTQMNGKDCSIIMEKSRSQSTGKRSNVLSKSITES